MIRKINYLLGVVMVIALSIGCDRSVCKNTNPLFDKYSFDAREYKNELVKQLGVTDKSKLSYWFKEYTVINDQEQLVFNVQGEGLCAMIVLDVEEWGKLDDLRRNRGVSYRGAQFTNLKFDIFQDSIKTKFLFRDFDEIID